MKVPSCSTTADSAQKMYIYIQTLHCPCYLSLSLKSIAFTPVNYSSELRHRVHIYDCQKSEVEKYKI